MVACYSPWRQLLYVHRLKYGPKGASSPAEWNKLHYCDLQVTLVNCIGVDIPAQV